MPMGPFRLCDLVGGDVGFHVAANFIQSFPERIYGNPSGAVPLLFQKKWLGEKTGKGFYRYDRDPENPKRIKPVKDIDAIAQILAESKKCASAEPLCVPQLPGLTDKDIIEMIFFPVVNEACRVLAEGIVEKAADLDIATVMSMGFPPYRGGIIHWADSEVGAARIAARLQSFADMFPHQSGFFVPCEYLLHCAHRGVPLSEGQNFYKVLGAKL